MTVEVAPSVGEVKPQTTPVQEPVAAVVETPVVETPVESVDLDQTPEEVAVSEDNVEQLANFIIGAGFDIDDVSAHVDKFGELPKEVLDKLTEKHGKAVTNMLVAQVAAMNQAHVAEVKKHDEAMFAHLQDTFKDVTEQTGEQTWNELKEWGKANLGEHKDEINSMLKQGGLMSKLAIDYMVNEFRGSDGYTQPAQLLDGDQMANDTAVSPLSKEGYNKELRELLKTSSYDSPEVKKLQARREKARRRGM